VYLFIGTHPPRPHSLQFGGSSCSFCVQVDRQTMGATPLEIERELHRARRRGARAAAPFPASALGQLHDIPAHPTMPRRIHEISAEADTRGRQAGGGGVSAHSSIASWALNRSVQPS
jgi:hypothetical protein